MIIFRKSPFTESFERSFLKNPGSSSRHHTDQPIRPQRNESVVRLAAGGTAWTHEVRDCRKDAPKLGLLWRANEKACDEARAPIRQRRLKFPQGCIKAPVRNGSARHRGVRKEYLPHLMRTKNDLAKLNESDTGKVNSRFLTKALKTFLMKLLTFFVEKLVFYKKNTFSANSNLKNFSLTLI